MTNAIKYFLLSTTAVILLLGSLWAVFSSSSVATLEAATIAELRGWAWSENTGWISMNCATGGDASANICTNSDYRVTVSDDSSHTLSGYAWSENVGWVQFGGLSGCPAGSCDARIISDGGTGAHGWELTGWARALAYTDPEAGGWDGWISLNCANTGTCTTSDYAIRVAFDGSVSSAAGPAGSFAWGDMNIGWLDFGQTAISSSCTPQVVNSCVDEQTSQTVIDDIWCGSDTTTTTCNPTDFCSTATGLCETRPTVNDFSISPSFVRSGQSVTVTWNVSNAADCEVVAGTPIGTGLSGSVSFTPYNLTTVTLTCDGLLLDTKTVTVTASTYES